MKKSGSNLCGPRLAQLPVGGHGAQASGPSFRCFQHGVVQVEGHQALLLATVCLEAVEPLWCVSTVETGACVG